MSSSPKFYITRSSPIINRCIGCTYIIKLQVGGIDREICTRCPHPKIQFVFGNCEEYRPSPAFRELISLIENILVKE